MELVKTRTGTELKLFELSQKIVEQECGLKLYDVEYISGSSTLRVFIMDPKSNTAVIEDCVKVDRGFTPYCETESWIPEDFILEVSSPGMYRDLKTLSHFEMAKGQTVLCKIDPESLEGEERERLKKLGVLTSLKVRGELQAVDADSVELKLESGENIKLNYDYIKKANLDPTIEG